jgi:hypothetical protein
MGFVLVGTNIDFQQCKVDEINGLLIGFSLGIELTDSIMTLSPDNAVYLTIIMAGLYIISGMGLLWGMDWGRTLLQGILAINLILHPIMLNIAIIGFLVIALHYFHQLEVESYFAANSNIENKST